MTDNQFEQLFGMVTKCVGGIQELQRDVTGLKTDVSELKTDVSELKTNVAELKQGQINLEAGQARIENEMQKTNKSLVLFNDDLHNLRVKVAMVEDRIDEKKQLSN
ncbi:MAG: hypothetical protein LH472_08865 [Pyrinomonadaceae bacterium]|nr:hypothetical protein [Pyrinomonadaceae bacterium]